VQVNAGIRHARPFPIWIGFVLCAALFGVELFDLATSQAVSVRYWVVDILTVVYLFMCVYRFHRILREVTFGAYPISPSQAVFYHLIPFFNLYWLFAWPSRFADYVKAERAIRVLPGAVIGLLFIVSALVARFYETSFGLAGYFGVMTYLTNRLRAYADYRDLDVAADQITPIAESNP